MPENSLKCRMLNINESYKVSELKDEVIMRTFSIQKMEEHRLKGEVPVIRSLIDIIKDEQISPNS
jgi:hypothetical protein